MLLRPPPPPPPLGLSPAAPTRGSRAADAPPPATPSAGPPAGAPPDEPPLPRSPSVSPPRSASLPLFQECCISSAWYEVLSVVHMMAMLALFEANLMLIPKNGQVRGERKVSKDAKKDVVDSLLKASGCLDYSVHHILAQIPAQVKSLYKDDNFDQKFSLTIASNSGLSDISQLEAKIERMDAQLAAKDRELATLTRTEAKNTTALKAQINKLQQEHDEFQKMVIGNQEAKNTGALKARIDKLQQERDEFQKMIIGNQQVHTQQIHEMKKKEKEYIKLLNQILMEKKKESSRTGMEIMNLLQKEGRQRRTWNGKKNDNDYYKMIVDAYEVKKQELMQENTDSRALLRSMQMDMREFLNAPNGVSQPADIATFHIVAYLYFFRNTY
ncbi:hypothetical protein ABZP36_031445 [Zizania latifolia]